MAATAAAAQCDTVWFHGCIHMFAACAAVKLRIVDSGASLAQGVDMGCEQP